MKLNQLIAKRIRQLLKKNDWTCYKLAEQSAIACSTLSSVVNCKRNSLHLETLLNICRGFNMTLNEFFEDKMFDLENIADD